MGCSVNRLFVLVAAATLLAACSGSSDNTSPSPSTSISPSPSTSASASRAGSGAPPTDEQVAWAGRVCTDAGQLKTSIQGLAAAATTGGGDVQTRLSAQIETIKTSVTTLTDTVAAAPSSGLDDPELAAVQTSSEQLRSSIDTLETAVNDVPGTSGAARTRALADVVAAANAPLTALGATTGAIGTAAKDGTGAIGQAFAANSSCSALTS